MSYEQNEPYMVIGLGNAYDYVVKNMTEPETYGTFQGNKESMKSFVEKVNRIVKEKEQLMHKCNCLQDRLDDCINVEKENEKLKKELEKLQKYKESHEKFKELVDNSEYVQDFLFGRL